MEKKIFLLILLFFFIFQHSLQELNSESNQEKEDREALRHEVIVTLKLVQVYVTDKKGDPVTDLVKNDFTLYDNGKLKKITDFEKHMFTMPEKKAEEKIKEKKPLPPEIQPKMNRKFFFILDYARNDLGAIIKSKKAALHFIDTQIQPTDEVGILSYSPVKGLAIHEYLTTDHQKVRKVIKGIKDVPEQGIPMHKLERVTKVSEDFPDTKMWIIEDEGLEEKVKRQKYHNFARDIKKLAKALRYVPGYKNILFFSAGLTRKLLYGKESSLLRDDYKEMSRELASSSCPVYSVNTEAALAKLAQFENKKLKGEDSLILLSKLSGGKYFGNINNYETVAKDIQKITGNYYVVGYYIDEKWDGKYHKIKIETRRKGCKVYAQQGYFNPKPFTEFSDFEKQIHLIGLALNRKSYFQEPLDFPMIALPFSDQKERNTILLSEIDVEKSKEVIKQKTEITTLIFDNQNNMVDLIKGEVDFSTIPQKKIYHCTITSLVPGRYECRVIIRNLITGKAAVAFSSVFFPVTSESRLWLYPLLLLIPERDAYYLFSKNKEKESETFPLKNIYPFISIKSSPLIEEIDQGVSKLLAVVRCSFNDIPEPEMDLSAYLIQDSSGQKTPLSFSILSAKSEEDKKIDILLIELQLPELGPGKYSFHLIAEEAKTKSKSIATRNFKIK